MSWLRNIPKIFNLVNHSIRFAMLTIAVGAFWFFFDLTHAQETNTCVVCHEKETPGIVGQWRDSKHGAMKVICLDCHQASQSDPDAFQHHGQTIATIVSPKDCAQCHQKEEAEFSASHHAKAAEFIGSLDNVLGVAVEGAPAARLKYKRPADTIPPPGPIPAWDA